MYGMGGYGGYGGMMGGYGGMMGGYGMGLGGMMNPMMMGGFGGGDMMMYLQVRGQQPSSIRAAERHCSRRP